MQCFDGFYGSVQCAQHVGIQHRCSEIHEGENYGAIEVQLILRGEKDLELMKPRLNVGLRQATLLFCLSCYYMTIYATRKVVI